MSLEDFIRELSSIIGEQGGVTLRYIVDLVRRYQDDHAAETAAILADIDVRLKNHTRRVLFDRSTDGEPLSPELIALLNTLPGPTIRTLPHPYDAALRHPESHRATSALYSLGFFSRSEDGLVLGYPTPDLRNPHGRALNRFFLQDALFQLVVLFLPHELRSLYLRHVSESRGESPPDDVPGRPQVSATTMRQFLELNYQSVFRCDARLAAASKVACKRPQRDAFQFYIHNGQFYMQEDAPVHVFSGTSGLVVYEELRGDSRRHKNPARRTYFNRLFQSKSPVYYQLDPRTTWRDGVLRSRRPLKVHAEVFAKALANPNIEVSLADFSAKENSWKLFYTLSSPRCGVAYSGRRDQVKQIAHGLVDGAMPPQERIDTEKTAYDCIHAMYVDEVAAIPPLKPLGPMAADAAYELALRTLRKWKQDYGR